MKFLIYSYQKGATMPNSYTPDTTITVTLNSELLNDVQSILDEIGIDMETAVVMYLEEIARQKRIPFEVTADTCL